MTNKDLRTCMLCRKKYSFCPVCNPEDKSKPTWYFCWCSDNCHEIDRIASAYEDGRITDIEAKEKLSKLDLSKKDNFGESYQKSIASIMKAQVKKTINKKEKKTDNESVKNDIVAEVEGKTDGNVE